MVHVPHRGTAKSSAWSRKCGPSKYQFAVRAGHFSGPWRARLVAAYPAKIDLYPLMVLLPVLQRTAAAAEVATGLALVETAPALWQARQPSTPHPSRLEKRSSRFFREFSFFPPLHPELTRWRFSR